MKSAGRTRQWRMRVPIAIASRDRFPEITSVIQLSLLDVCDLYGTSLRKYASGWHHAMDRRLLQCFLFLVLDIRALLYALHQACIKGDVSSVEPPRVRFYLGFRKTTSTSHTRNSPCGIAFRGYFLQRRDSSEFGRDRSWLGPGLGYLDDLRVRLRSFVEIFSSYPTLHRLVGWLNRNDVSFDETMNFKSKNVITRCLINFIHRRVRSVQATRTKLLLPSSARFVGN